MLRQRRDKAVFPHAGQILDLGPEPIHILPGASRHSVAVHVYRIDRIGHSHPGFRRQQLLQRRSIGFCAIRNIDFIHAQCDAPGLVEVFADGCPQEIIALFRAVAPEAFHRGHFQRGVGHGPGHHRRQRTGHIPNAQADDPPAGMALFIGRHPGGHLLKQVPSRHGSQMRIECWHRRLLGLRYASSQSPSNTKAAGPV